MAASFRSFLEDASRLHKTEGVRLDGLTSDERVLAVLQGIHFQLEILNKHMSLITDTEIEAVDLDDEFQNKE